MTRLASCSLIAAFLLVAGCHHHRYHDDDDGWRDGDRDHRHHPRYERDDDNSYRDRDYR
jgi:outer membrane biogenesis lipoprotein LolB